MTEVTVILEEIEHGRARTSDLLPIVYEELRRLANQQMQLERPDLTLQPTALVHEAFLRLAGTDDRPVSWENRRHFFGAAAMAMQRILVDQARRKNRLRHGGELQQVPLDEAEIAGPHQVAGEDLLSLNEALTEFEVEDARKAELVRLRYFAGLTEDEAARTLGISRATAARWWSYAKAWLFARVQGQPSQQGEE